MFEKEEKLNYTSSKFRCGHCGNVSPLVLRDSYTQKQVLELEHGNTWESGDMYTILECPSCLRITLTVADWHEAMESESELSHKVLYPNPELLPSGMPEKIRKGYDAAVKVKSIDANAYAVLMRRLLELVCEDRKAAGDDLYGKLSDLSQKNEIPSKLLDVAHGLRHLGNIGAHAELGDVTDKEIPILKALIDAILEYVYSAPFLAQLAKERSDKLKAAKKSGVA